MGKIKDNTYVVIQSFMLTDLHLKGNELIIYAIIYGFSQEDGQTFSGSLQYLAEWTNTTKQSVLNCLKSLLEKQYIAKNEKFINGVKFVEYYSINFNEVLKKIEYPIQKSLIGGIKKSLPNNINIDNINNNILYIVDFLNKKTSSRFRNDKKQTQDLIKARFFEGFTVADFETVIKNKCSEWQGTKMAVYLRPQTLFGEKFESYLNAKQKTEDEPAYNLDEFEMAALKTTPKGVKVDD